MKKSSRKNSREISLEQALKWGQSQLRVLGKTEARASTERLLEEILDCDRLRLYMDAAKPLSGALLKKFRFWVLQRKKRIPLDYLLGRTHFWNEILEVGPGCLIPRPSTEVLVEKFTEKSGLAKNRAFSFLDMGCGSGAIGIALLRHYPQSSATFADISAKALAVTKRNLNRYGLLDRARLVKTNLFQKLDPMERWDAILSNPPYLSAKDLKIAQPEVLREPMSALDGGKDGLDWYRKIAEEAPRYLKENGLLVLEMGKGQAKKIKSFCRSNFEPVEIYKDYANIDRVLIARLHG